MAVLLDVLGDADLKIVKVRVNVRDGIVTGLNDDALLTIDCVLEVLLRELVEDMVLFRVLGAQRLQEGDAVLAHRRDWFDGRGYVQALEQQHVFFYVQFF